MKPHSVAQCKPKPYGCGCGNCSLDVYLRCPNPVKSTELFPYLDIRGLTKSETENLTSRLEEESKQIMFSFQGIVTQLRISLSEQKISPSTLTADLMSLGTLEHTLYTGPSIPYFYKRFQEMERAQDIDTIFIIIQGYTSFFDHGIIEHIVKFLGTENDKKMFQEYQEQLKEYCKRRVFECPPIYAAQNDPYGSNIVVKHDSKFAPFTPSQLQGFKHKLSKILHVSEHTLLLCTVEEGCIQMTYHLPGFVADRLFSLSNDQKTQLQQEGVIRFSCGDYHLSLAEQVCSWHWHI